MNIAVDPSGNCGLRHITGTVGYNGRPVDFLRDFCKKYESANYSAEYNPNGPKLIRALSTFYSFSGCVKDKGKDVTYASAVADLIKARKLGSIYETRPLRNNLYPEGHLIKVFIWHPDKDALNAWRQTDEGKDKPKG